MDTNKVFDSWCYFILMLVFCDLAIANKTLLLQYESECQTQSSNPKCQLRCTMKKARLIDGDGDLYKKGLSFYYPQINKKLEDEIYKKCYQIKGSSCKTAEQLMDCVKNTYGSNGHTQLEDHAWPTVGNNLEVIKWAPRKVNIPNLSDDELTTGGIAESEYTENESTDDGDESTVNGHESAGVGSAETETNELESTEDQSTEDQSSRFDCTEDESNKEEPSTFAAKEEKSTEEEPSTLAATDEESTEEESPTYESTEGESTEDESTEEESTEEESTEEESAEEDSTEDESNNESTEEESAEDNDVASVVNDEKPTTANQSQTQNYKENYCIAIVTILKMFFQSIDPEQIDKNLFDRYVNWALDLLDGVLNNNADKRPLLSTPPMPTVRPKSASEVNTLNKKTPDSGETTMAYIPTKKTTKRTVVPSTSPRSLLDQLLAPYGTRR